MIKRIVYYGSVLMDRALNYVNGLKYLPIYFGHKGWVFLSVATPRFKRNNTNWGDDVSLILVELLTKKKVIPYTFAFQKKEHYLCIGSIIQWYSDNNAVIWGAGLMSSKVSFAPPKKVLAVRGPLTRKQFINNNIECPETYGDPALLFPRFYKPKVKKKFKLGVILHFSEVSKINFEIPESLNKNDILKINIAKYGHWKSFIDKILSCECIITSSLHGVIISDAYLIPNLWASFSSYKSADNNFKFRDYYLSIQKSIIEPQVYSNIMQHPDLISYISGKWTQPVLDLDQLIDSCPFEYKDLLLES